MPLAFPLLFSLIVAAPAPAFVAADVVNLRAEPNECAPVLAKLRIATPVVIEETRGDFEPHRAALYGELARAHRAAGREDAARTAEALAHGDGPNFVAICNAVPNTGALLVAASYRRGRGWTSWTSLPFKELVRMKLEMAGLAWARVADSSAEPMSGSPFPSPSAGVFYNGLALELQAISLGNWSEVRHGSASFRGP